MYNKSYDKNNRMNTLMSPQMSARFSFAQDQDHVNASFRSEFNQKYKNNDSASKRDVIFSGSETVKINNSFQKRNFNLNISKNQTYNVSP